MLREHMPQSKQYMLHVEYSKLQCIGLHRHCLFQYYTNQEQGCGNEPPVSLHSMTPSLLKRHFVRDSSPVDIIETPDGPVVYLLVQT